MDFPLRHLPPMSKTIMNISKLKTSRIHVVLEIDSNIRSNGRVILILTTPRNLLYTLLAALSKNSTAEIQRNPAPRAAESTQPPSSHPPMNLFGISNFTSFEPPVFPSCTHEFSLSPISFIHISRVNLWACYSFCYTCFQAFRRHRIVNTEFMGKRLKGLRL